MNTSETDSQPTTLSPYQSEHSMKDTNEAEKTNTVNLVESFREGERVMEQVQQTMDNLYLAMSAEERSQINIKDDTDES